MTYLMLTYAGGYEWYASFVDEITANAWVVAQQALPSWDDATTVTIVDTPSEAVVVHNIQ